MFKSGIYYYMTNFANWLAVLSVMRCWLYSTPAINTWCTNPHVDGVCGRITTQVFISVAWCLRQFESSRPSVCFCWDIWHQLVRFRLINLGTAPGGGRFLGFIKYFPKPKVFCGIGKLFYSNNIALPVNISILLSKCRCYIL